MASSMGRTPAAARSLRASQIPMGKPITMQKRTEVSTRARVIMASDQAPIRPMTIIEMTVPTARRRPAICQGGQRQDDDHQEGRHRLQAGFDTGQRRIDGPADGLEHRPEVGHQPVECLLDPAIQRNKGLSEGVGPVESLFGGALPAAPSQSPEAAASGAGAAPPPEPQGLLAASAAGAAGAASAAGFAGVVAQGVALISHRVRPPAGREFPEAPPSR